MPTVSILVRAYNEAKHIGNLLALIRGQTLDDYEIILVDSGSTDATVRIAEEHCHQILHLDSSDFTFGYSLNLGSKAAKGRYIAIVSAHAYPRSPEWLDRLIAPFEDERVAMVYGRHVGAKQTKFSERRDFGRFFGDERLVRRAPHYYANNANSAIRKDLWQKHPFDEYLTGLEDIAWAKHFMKEGYEVAYQPDAAVSHIHDESWRQVFNRYRREARAAKVIGLDAPPHGGMEVRDLITNVGGDLVDGWRDLSAKKLQEIALFRFNQWRGARLGWKSNIDLRSERYELYYGGSNEAVVIASAGKAALERVPIEPLKPGDALVEVSHVGVCQTDIEVFQGELGYYRDGRAKYPIIPGHEFSGRVVQVGANAQHLAVGDRVVGECILSCGKCLACGSGSHIACTRRREVGVMNFNGAYARYVVVPAPSLHAIPSEIPDSVASLVEPIAVVHKGLRRVAPRLEPNAKCGVVGAGPIGNLCAQTLALRGFKVASFDKNGHRVDLLRGVAERNTEIEDLDRFDLVVEATGNVSALGAVLSGCRADATVLLLGFPYGIMPFNFESIVAEERVVVGSVGSTAADFDSALADLPSLETEPFTEAIFPLEQYEDAWRAHRSSEKLKVMLRASSPGAT